MLFHMLTADSLSIEGVREGVGEEPNNMTASKPAPIEIIQYSLVCS